MDFATIMAATGQVIQAITYRATAITTDQMT